MGKKAISGGEFPRLANSVAEAAQRLGMGKSTLYKLIDNREIRAFRVGDRMLIAEAELLRFISQRMEATA